jgi:hypothetical protein
VITRGIHFMLSPRIFPRDPVISTTCTLRRTTAVTTRKTWNG